MLARIDATNEVPEAFLAPAPPLLAAALERWFWASFNAAAACAGYGTADRLALAMIAYGEYVDRFLELTLPSLLAPGNLAALDRPLIIIHTDERGKRLLCQVMGLLIRHAQVEIYLIPEDIIALADNSTARYWLLGAAQQLHIQMTKCKGYDYHMLYPDVVYARDFFANLICLKEMGHSAILHGGISAKLDTVAAALRARNFDLSAAALHALALDHLHPRMAQFIVNGREGYPPVPLFLLAERGCLHYCCPHLNILYLAHRHLLTVPLVLFNTVDAALAQILPSDIPIYAPTRDDAIGWIELSDDDKIIAPFLACNLGECAIRFWVMCWCNKGYERYLGLDCELALPEDYLPPWPLMSPDEVSRFKEDVRKAVTETGGVSEIMLPMVVDAFERGKAA